MNIVIIDDEPVILSGIAGMIPQMDPDWHIFDRFSDAEEALNNCDWDEVQVVLADISMPGMDGLTLVAELRENGFDTLVIFITAHANFSYAQRGAHLQMFDYLLKPVSKADLENVLRRAQQQYEKVKAGTETAEYIEQNLHTLRKHYLGDLMFEERLIQPQEMERRLREYRLAEFRYQVALFKTQLSRAAVKQALTEALSSCQWMLYGQEFCFEILLLLEPGGDPGRLEAALKQMNGQYAVSPPRLSIGDLAAAFRRLLPEAQSAVIPEDDRLENALRGRELSASVQMAKEYIDRHYPEHLSLKKLADAVYLHPTYLSNVFKKQTGFAVVDYINEVRIAQAKKLLPDPRNRIYWILEQVGFSNQRYFSHVFKTLTGRTPMQYRENALLCKIPEVPADTAGEAKTP